MKLDPEKATTWGLAIAGLALGAILSAGAAGIWFLLIGTLVKAVFGS